MPRKQYRMYCAVMYEKGKPTGAIYVNAHNKESALNACKKLIEPRKVQEWKCVPWNRPVPKDVQNILNADDMFRAGA